MALIELSPDQPLVTPAPLPPAYRYRALGLALAVVLVLALAGAAPQQVFFWQRAGLVSLPFEADFQIAGGRLFTFEVTNGRRVTSAWAVKPLRRMWRVVNTADDVAGGLLQGGSSVSVAGDFVLLQAAQTSTVLDARTGAVRWSSSLPVVPLTATVGMVEQEHFRSGTEYDEQSGAPGALFFSSSGRPHTEPPQHTDLTGVDLATGRPLWTAGYAGSIYPAKARGRAGTVFVFSSDQLSLRSAVDGKVLVSRPVAKPADGASATAETVGDLVLLRRAGVVTAYTMADLDRRWQRDEPENQNNYASCTGLPCEKAGPLLAVLDPLTGVPRWRTDGQVDVVAGAGYALQVQSEETKPVRAVDRVSGALMVDLGDWQSYALTSAGAGQVVLTRTEPGGIVFGLLRPDSRDVQTLGRTKTPVSDCFADVRFVACRAPTGVEVFTYAA